MWDVRYPNQPAVVALWGGSDSVAALAAVGQAFLLLAGGPGDDLAPTLRAAYVTSRGGSLEPRDWSFTLPSTHGECFVAVLPQPGAPDGGRLLLVCSHGSLMLLDTATKSAVCSGSAPEWEDGDDAADARGALDGPLACIAATWVSEALFATAQRNGTVRLWRLPEGAVDPRRAVPERDASAGGSMSCVAQLRLGKGGDGEELTELLFAPGPEGPAAGGTLLALLGGTLWALPVLLRGESTALAPPSEAHPPEAPPLRRIALLPSSNGGIALLALRASGGGPAVLRVSVGAEAVRSLHAGGGCGDAESRAALSFAMQPLSIDTGGCTGVALALSGPAVQPLLRSLSGSAAPHGRALLRSAAPEMHLRLAATAHAGGCVRLWEASSEALSPLLSLQLPAEEGEEAPELACLDLDPRSGLLLTVSATGVASLHALEAEPAPPFLIQPLALPAPPALCCLATRLRMAAFADCAGGVTLLRLPALAPSSLPRVQLLPSGDRPAALCMLAVGAAAAPTVVLLGASGAAALLAPRGRTLSLPHGAQGGGLAAFGLDGMGVLLGPLGAAMEGHPCRAFPARGAGESDEEAEEAEVPRCELLLLCGADGVRQYDSERLVEALPAAAEAEQAHTPQPRRSFAHAPALWAAPFCAPGGAVVAILHRSLELTLLAAAKMEPLRRLRVEEAVGGGLPFAGDAPRLLALSPDGHLLSLWADTRGEPLPLLCRSELLEEFSAPHPPPELGGGRFWEEGRAEVEAEGEEEEEAEGPPSSGRGGFFARMKEKGREALKRSGVGAPRRRKLLTGADLFALMPAFELAQPSPAPPTRPLSKLSVGAPLEPTGAGARSSLLGERRGERGFEAEGPVGPRSADEIRAKYGKPRKGAAEGMAENLDKLNERGEKLMNIQEKTQRMEMEAAEFAKNAKKLADKQTLGGMLFSW